MALLTATTSSACQGAQGIITLSQVAAGHARYYWTVIDAGNTDFGGDVDPSQLPYELPVPNGDYSVRVYADDNGPISASTTRPYSLACTGGGTVPGALLLDSLTNTDETAAGNDGTATIQASGGTPPLTATLVELSLSQAVTSGVPVTFSGLPASTYTVRVTDSTAPTAQQVGGTVTVAAYSPPIIGCTDEYATDYDPAATVAGACSYVPRWRSAWGPTGLAVRVAAVPGQAVAYVEARLRVGFRPGHPLAGVRPLGAPLTLRATIGPDGYATFVLGPYLRPLLGAPDGAGGYRLDLNSPTATTTDLYVGYELRRPTGELLEHGYALNAAVPDEAFATNTLLTCFDLVPVWPGFSLPTSWLSNTGAGAYGQVATGLGAAVDMPCPANPLPVAWLNPQGGFDLWVFSGRPVLADVVGDGQRYREADTGESRWSERGESRRTYTASSGPFRGAEMAEGLATLARSPQVWVQPVAGAAWVPVTIDAGTFPVQRWGVQRNEVSITFTTARAEYSQGQ